MASPHTKVPSPEQPPSRIEAISAKKPRIDCEEVLEEGNIQVVLQKYQATGGSNAASSTIMDHFTRLSDELLLKIISNLKIEDIAKVASQVNKRFQKVCLDSTLWSNAKLELPEIFQEIDLRKAFSLLDHCPLLERLDLSYSPDAAMLAVYALRYCPRLEELTVQLNQDMEGLLKAIAKYGHSLRKLVNSDIIDEDSARDWNIEVMFCNVRGLRNLTTIDLSNLDRGKSAHGTEEEHRLTNLILKGIADHCLQLEHLIFQDFDGFGEGLVDETMNHFLSKVHHKIKILVFDGECLTDASYKSLQECQLLEKLVINYAIELRSAGFEAISKLSNLKEFEIWRGCELSSLDFIQTFSHNKLGRLRVLLLHGCYGLDNAALKEIADNCPLLTKLSLDQCDSIADEGVKYSLHNCSNLLELCLYRMENVTAEAFESIQPTLRKLNLEECEISFFENQFSKIKARNPRLQINTLNMIAL